MRETQIRVWNDYYIVPFLVLLLVASSAVAADECDTEAVRTAARTGDRKDSKHAGYVTWDQCLMAVPAEVESASQ